MIFANFYQIRLRGITPVILTVTFRRIAVNLLALFSPLYVLQIVQNRGFSLNLAVLSVIFYILLIYLTKLLTLPLAENTAFRLGFRRVLILSSLPFALFLAFLFLSQKNPLFLILVSVFWGIHAALFWFGYHGLFVKFGDEEHFGRQTGISQALAVLAGVLTPVLGGLIVFKFSFHALFFLAGLIFLLAILMIVVSSEIKPRHDARLRVIWQLFRTHKKVVVAYLGHGGEAAVYGTIWPVFLFLLLGEILTFAEVVSASVLVAAVLAYLFGIWVDRVGWKQILGIGGVVGAGSWLARIVARTPLPIVGIDGSYRVTEEMLAIPLSVFSYQKAIEGGTGQALYFREISLTFGAVVFLILTAVLVFFNLPLWSTFVLAAIGALMPLLIVKK